MAEHTCRVRADWRSVIKNKPKALGLARGMLSVWAECPVFLSKSCCAATTVLVCATVSYCVPDRMSLIAQVTQTQRSLRARFQSLTVPRPGLRFHVRV